MPLSPEEARVLACLVEKEATVPDAYPLTLNALRLACNQSSNRHPIVAYDDRIVEQALMALKSIGLVRFVHPSQGGRTIRYRHVADERWRLERNELAVLATLVLRGPQTTGELRARTERLVDPDGTSIDDALDALAGRSPEPFAVRLERHHGEREAPVGPPSRGRTRHGGDDPARRHWFDHPVGRNAGPRPCGRGRRPQTRDSIAWSLCWAWSPSLNPNLTPASSTRCGELNDRWATIPLPKG